MFKLSQCNDPVSVAAFIKRLGIVHKRLIKLWYWSSYHAGGTSPKAWITSNYRVIGVSSFEPEVSLKPGELLIPVELPFRGSGSDIVELIVSERKRHARLVEARKQKLRRIGVSKKSSHKGKATSVKRRGLALR